MKRFLIYGFVFCLGILFTEAIGRLTVNELLAAQQPQVATVVAGTAYPPQDIAVFLGDTLYVCPQWHPSTTPTRIFTPTNLAETVTPTLRPSSTATPTVGACRLYTVIATTLRIRNGASLSAAILRTLTKGETVSLSTLAKDTVNDTANGITWRKLCTTAEYLSGAYVEVKP